MSIPAAAVGTPIPRPNATIPFVDPKTGILSQHGLTLLDQWRAQMVGANRITPCSAAGTNVIALMPNDAAPLIEKYVDYEFFPFVAEHNSTGAVTMTVVPAKGALGELKAYITGGAAQAGSGDVVGGRLYVAIYVDALDSGAGGFVLK